MFLYAPIASASRGVTCSFRAAVGDASFQRKTFPDALECVGMWRVVSRPFYSTFSSQIKCSRQAAPVNRHGHCLLADTCFYCVDYVVAPFRRLTGLASYLPSQLIKMARASSSVSACTQVLGYAQTPPSLRWGNRNTALKCPGCPPPKGAARYKPAK
jgi:hypothetical protein